MSTALATDRESLFASGAFVRLWGVGVITNVTLWFEVLAASLFTLQVTGSGFAVALVTAARAAPLLVVGAPAGVFSDAWDRKKIVLTGLLVSAGSASAVSLLAWLGRLEPLHVGLAALVSGVVYATEMPARRRMIAESAGDGQVDRAIAADSLTGYAARCVGPILGGWAYQTTGLAGAFFASSLCSLVAFACAIGLEHRQVLRRLAWGAVRTDLFDALRFTALRPTLIMLLAVTFTMNLCGYSYTTLIAPVAKLGFDLDATQTGFLAAAEPGGAFLGGLLLMRLELPGLRIFWLMAGVLILTGGLVATAVAGLAGLPFVGICAVLASAGIGSAIYTNNQTSIVMAETPPALRSRMFGLVTIVIGSWPFGMLLAGALVSVLSPLVAMATLGVLGIASIGALAAVRHVKLAKDTL